MTGVYTAHQVIAAAAVGAEYAAPYLNRICTKLGSKEAGLVRRCRLGSQQVVIVSLGILAMAILVCAARQNVRPCRG